MKRLLGLLDNHFLVAYALILIACSGIGAALAVWQTRMNNPEIDASLANDPAGRSSIVARSR